MHGVYAMEGTKRVKWVEAIAFLWRAHPDGLAWLAFALFFVLLLSLYLLRTGLLCAFNITGYERHRGTYPFASRRVLGNMAEVLRASPPPRPQATEAEHQQQQRLPKKGARGPAAKGTKAL